MVRFEIVDSDRARRTALVEVLSGPGERLVAGRGGGQFGRPPGPDRLRAWEKEGSPGPDLALIHLSDLPEGEIERCPYVAGVLQCGNVALVLYSGGGIDAGADDTLRVGRRVWSSTAAEGPIVVPRPVHAENVWRFRRAIEGSRFLEDRHTLRRLLQWEVAEAEVSILVCLHHLAVGYVAAHAEHCGDGWGPPEISNALEVIGWKALVEVRPDIGAADRAKWRESVRPPRWWREIVGEGAAARAAVEKDWRERAGRTREKELSVVLGLLGRLEAGEVAPGPVAASLVALDGLLHGAA